MRKITYREREAIYYFDVCREKFSVRLTDQSVWSVHNAIGAKLASGTGCTISRTMALVVLEEYFRNIDAIKERNRREGI